MTGRAFSAVVLLLLLMNPVSAEEDGRALYLQNCASCHGTNLEGQPAWRSPRPDGTWPAPPHSIDGHTWHHPDAMLLDYVRRGGQAVLDDLGVEFASAMPAFGDVLSDAQIEAILDYIKSIWPDEVRAAQEARE
jgi:mono/diheme cytochrome c family protein